MIRALHFLLVAFLVGSLPAKEPADQPEDDFEISWQLDFDAAWKEAAAARRSLFIFFHDPQQEKVTAAVETTLTTEKSLRPQLEKYVLVKLPVDYCRPNNDKNEVLLKTAPFAHLHGRSGLAIIDLRDRKGRHFGEVVSLYPFARGRHIWPRHLATLLDLPDGSLTQRTLIFAVRTHPDSPRSTTGNLHPFLSEQAERHSLHQANIHVQGHHNWDSRFHLINARMPGSLLAREVVAESWPGQELLDAARECVHSWRQSSGHWEAVSQFQPQWGYDMKRGSNGIWYGTGIFANR